MKSYEFSRYYNPKDLEICGSGVIADSVLKPMRSVMSAVFKKFAKPMAKKALESGIPRTGEQLGKKISEKSGDLIMKKLANKRGPKGPRSSASKVKSTPKQQESTDAILNRLISGEGLKKKKKGKKKRI